MRHGAVVPFALALSLSACTLMHPAANYIGNTLYVQPQSGTASHSIRYHADRSCDVVFATTRYACTYAVRGDQICLTAVRHGDNAATTRCHPFERLRRAGESWDGIDDGPTHYRLVAGQDGRLVDADLIGAWKLVHSVMVTQDGRSYPVPNYGSNPQGYLIYDRSHVMCVFLAVGETRDPPPESYRELMPAIPASYCALWRIADDGRTVLHDVQVGNDPALMRATLRRQAARHGRTLTLRRDPVPAGLHDYALTFERVDGRDGQ